MDHSVATAGQVIAYPESDGQPVGETERHVRLMLELFHMLCWRFRQDDQVYVGANMFVYYEEGVLSSSFAPDVFFVRGVPKIERRTYKIWEEGKAPDAVIELTSRSTRIEDLGSKKVVYQDLGIQEYFLFDPWVEYLSPPLQGYLLRGDEYVRMEPSEGRLESRVMGLELGLEDAWLRLYEPGSVAPLHTAAEAEELLTEAEQRLAESEAARQHLEDEIQGLREQLNPYDAPGA